MQTVNARDLHAYLGVVKDFSDWIKYQAKRAGLTLGHDYVTTTDSQKRGNQTGGCGGRPIRDYHLTLDSAKHLAMMAGTVVQARPPASVRTRLPAECGGVSSGTIRV